MSDYSTYLMAKQRMTELHAEARADRLAHAARRGRADAVSRRRTWPALLRGRLSRIRHRTRLTEAVDAVALADGAKP